MMTHKTGSEYFTFQGISEEFSVLDFWSWCFSDLYEVRSKLAEYLVVRALGIADESKAGYWSAQYVTYRKRRIGIRVSCNSDDKAVGTGMKKLTRHIDIRERNNDLFVFCMNESAVADDLELIKLDKWLFYVMPLWYIRSESGAAKTITQGKVKRLAKAVNIYELRNMVDEVIDHYADG